MTFTVRAAYRRMQALACDVLRVMALALDMPPDFFRTYFARHASVMRVQHHLAQPGQAAPSGGHADHGALGLRLPEHGLQVRLRNGGWVDVKPAANALVVNIGDLMALWTNDRWVSSLYRISPPAELVANARLSVAFFATPDPRTTISCIPSCAGPDMPVRYPPVQAGAYWAGKFVRPRGRELQEVAPPQAA